MNLRVKGKENVQAPAAQVWAALVDPVLLQRCIPGCKRLELVGDQVYQVTMEVGVAAVKGKFAGQVQLSDLAPPRQLVLNVQADGPTGFVHATAHIELTSRPGSTQVGYDGRADIGGKIAGVGQRVCGGVAKFLAGQFFKAFSKELSANSKR